IQDGKAKAFDTTTQKWVSQTFFVPTAPGKYVFEVTVTNQFGQQSTKRFVQEILAPRQIAAADEESPENIRKLLMSKPTLGATDLLATFQKAADLAADGKGLEIVYVGDGVDTLNEASGPVLVEKIATLFKDKKVHVSTVAIGSSYERPVLQGLAAALGGTFTHVEGAA